MLFGLQKILSLQYKEKLVARLSGGTVSSIINTSCSQWTTATARWDHVTDGGSRANTNANMLIYYLVYYWLLMWVSRCRFMSFQCYKGHIIAGLLRFFYFSFAVCRYLIILWTDVLIRVGESLSDPHINEFEGKILFVVWYINLKVKLKRGVNVWFDVMLHEYS